MKPYLPKLDSIRFYAFLMVFISHSYFNSKNALSETFPILTYKGDRWFAHGEFGVQIFFMLSGFLILYLSIRQLQKSDSFSILNFFKKRILRIWPLYFLMIGISYALYIWQGKAIALGCTSMYMYFFGNVCIYKGLPDVISTITIGPLWSVSIEQQFYTVFPFLFLLAVFAYRKNKTKTAYVSVFVSLCIIVACLFIRYTHAEDWLFISYTFASAMPALVSGMLLAICVSARENIFMKIAQHRRTLTIIGIIVFLYAFHLKFLGLAGAALYIVPICIATAIAIILSVFSNKKENTESNRIANTTQYLGRISYGLYVYHMLSIVSINYLYQYFGAAPQNLTVIFSKIVVTFLLTVGLAHLSYKYFESWFLRFK